MSSEPLPPLPEQRTVVGLPPSLPSSLCVCVCVCVFVSLGGLNCDVLIDDDELKQVGLGMLSVDFLATVASFPKPDDKIRRTSLKVQGGGNSGNALTCVARLGLSPRLISKVADDSQGQSIIEELEADGVDTSYIVNDFVPRSIAFVDCYISAAIIVRPTTINGGD
ncbi:hypothetical protein CDL15_Pgr009985 [Punica granatum]|uniref:Carbohydrate kinase PfkB domain-containing protein n=1 Tax=Punica granatum TaxID=22663 RepID=A0A218X4U0_PUNGR|nr:hypothetical protein CDL15_Pgr009985 [Punica granatum]